MFLLSFAAYGNTLTHDYCWDDSIVLLENSKVQQGISGIPNLFTKSNTVKLEDRYGYRPISLITFAIQYQFAPDNPFPGHLMNVILFGLLCVLMLSTLQKLLTGYGDWLPFLVTLIFLAHPLHVEVVANMKSRDEILALMFSLLALYFFLQHFDERKWLPYVFSALFMLLAYLSKEGSLTFLGALPLSVIAFRRAPLKEYLVSLLPLAGVLLVAGVILIWVFPENTIPKSPEGGPEYYMESMMLNNSMFRIQSGLGAQFANGMHLYLRYLKNFAWPYPLMYFSGYNVIPAVPGFNIIMFIGFLFFAGGLGFALWKLRKLPLFSWSILYFMGTILIYLQILFRLSDTFADRFMFMPSLGLCLLLVVLLAKLLGIDLHQKNLPFLPATQTVKTKSGKTKSKKIRPTGKAYAFGAIFVLIFLGFMGRTIHRNLAWKNNMTLFSTDMEHLDASSKAHFYYAEALNTAYDTASNKAQMEEEILKHYKRAIEISDSSYYAYLGLADASIRFGKYDQAVTYMERMVQFYPHMGDPWFFLGKGRFFQEDWANAAKDLEKSKELNPYPTETWFLLGLSWSRSQQYEKAEKVLKEGIEKYPGSIQLLSALSECYFESQRFEESFPLLEEVIDRDPYNPDHWRTIIGRYNLIGENELAVSWLEEAQRRGIAL